MRTPTRHETYAKVLSTTPDVIQEMFEDLAKGLSLEEACVLHSIAYDDVLALQERDESFSLNVRRSRIHLKKLALDTLLSESGRKTGAATRLLNRLFPEEEKAVTPEKVSKIIANLDSSPLVDPRANLTFAPAPRSKSADEAPATTLQARLERIEASGAEHVLRPAPKTKPAPPASNLPYSVDTF